MERMDMHSRNEYLKVLRGEYLKAKTKKEKSLILDEYCGNTGQARKYVIRKIQPGVDIRLKQRIPIRLTQWDTSQVGYVEGMVVHCGSSTMGEYMNTLSTTEISSGWWEGEAIMGRFQEHSFWALREIRKRTPFEWRWLDSDNGQEFINQILYKYCQREKLEFTRSRPNRKNDNAYIEQKN